MGNLTIALVFVLVMNCLMFLTQASMLELETNGTVFYNTEGTLLEAMATDNNTNPMEDLPSSQNIEVSNGNVFTDVFNNILSWMKSAPGISYIYSIASSPYNLLKATGLPDTIVGVLGTLWYALTIFLIVAFLWGREV